MANMETKSDKQFTNYNNNPEKSIFRVNVLYANVRDASGALNLLSIKPPKRGEPVQYRLQQRPGILLGVVGPEEIDEEKPIEEQLDFSICYTAAEYYILMRGVKE